MSLVISKEQTDMLRSIILKHDPHLTGVVDQIGVTPLTDEQRQDLRVAVSMELLETGLDEQDEHNARGLILEDIIDVLGHL